MAGAEMEEVDFELILDDEFDAFNLEVKPEDDDIDEQAPRKFPAKLHARKVAHELGITSGLIYLPGEPTRYYEESDQGPAFRQRRYFYYITGANFADAHVTYEIESDRLTLFIPYVEPRQVLWYGRTPTAAQAAQAYDVDEVRYSNELQGFFREYFTSHSLLLVLESSKVQRELLGYAGKIDQYSLQPAMDIARCIKTDFEIAEIRRANDVSSHAHREVARVLKRLKNEQEIEAVFRAACTSRGAHRQAYPIIAGAGENASTLHYGANDQPLKGKELLVIDGGCEWNCYASDVTRTLPIRGVFSREGKAIYNLVEKMQEECIKAIRPGGSFYLLHLHACHVAINGLLSLGILKGSKEDIENKGLVSAFFPHGLGHHVGLEVHDVSGEGRLMGSSMVSGKREEVTPNGLAALKRAYAGEAKRGQRLQPGMVVTVEPGIYFCREYIEGYFLSRPEYAKHIDRDLLERYYPVGGARIEDDILVTEDGYENLTKAPKGEELVDIINGL